MPRGGHNKKPTAEHVLAGTYRADRHGSGARVSANGIYRSKPAAIVRATARSQRKWTRSEADERALTEGFRFNEALAEHAAEFFPAVLCHSMGDRVGEPFEVEDWQRDEIIYPLFGWVRPDGLRRYRRSYIEMPKKNGKSTLNAGLGLYGLVADEEPSAEIYSLGADKSQARVVFDEAVKMVDASPALRSILKVMRAQNSMAILCPALTSVYRPLSATPRGKHGINIHMGVIDELHEWYGDKLWNAIKFAYRARRQPMQLVITNAGDDLESVCRQQHDKAQQIIDGTLYDPTFLAIIYAVEREEAEAEIEAVGDGATELPIARKCNPALGSILKEETLVNDIKDAIATPREIPNLLRLTYGVWATGRDPWLSIEDWDEAYEKFALSLFRRKRFEVWTAFDLAKVRDLTALVNCARRDDEYLLWSQFWMPEERARKLNHLAPFLQWAEDGFITLHSSRAVDHKAVADDCVDVLKGLDLQEITYDDWYADQVSLQLEEETGAPRTEFTQSMSNFAGPTAQFERLLLNGKIKHDGNPVLRWQASHVQVARDNNENMRPVKPHRGGWQTIDGIVAAVMAVGRAAAGAGGEPVGGYYESNSLEMG